MRVQEPGAHIVRSRSHSHELPSQSSCLGVVYEISSFSASTWLRHSSLAASTRTRFRHDSDFFVRSHELPFIDPHFDPNLTVSRLRLSETIVDVSTQRVEWHPPCTIPLAPCHLRPSKTSRRLDADPLCTKAQC